MTGRLTWALGDDCPVSPDTWTPVPMPNLIVNTDQLTVDTNGYDFHMHTSGLWSLMVNLAWTIDYVPNQWARLDARVMSGTGGFYVPVAAQSNHAHLSVTGPWWQQLCMQPGHTAQEWLWRVEVRSSVDATCAHDGFLAPIAMSAFLCEA